MSIKKSFQTYILLLTSIPVIVMTVLAYILAYGKYMELTKNSMQTTTSTYMDGFHATLNNVISDNEILAGNLYIQSFLTEKANNPGMDFTASMYYKPVSEQLDLQMDANTDYVTYSLYDIDGYYVLGTASNTGDWSEYMNTPPAKITKTTIETNAPISDDKNAIDIITPVIVKDKVIGIVRANVKIDYFGAFASGEECFIIDADGSFLFHQDDLKEDSYIMNRVNSLLPNINNQAEKEMVYTAFKSNSSTYIYGYGILHDYDWIYIVRMNRKAYHAIFSSLPLLLAIGLIIILFISLIVSSQLTKKYTDPIMELNSCMLEATGGNYQIVCNIESKDEFGQLSNCFNEMMKIISGTNERQLEAQRQLEANEAQLIEHNKHVEELAYTDGLTSLYNRIAFMKLAQDILSEAKSSYKKHAVIFIDLDDFKNVNDTLGHDYGDDLLIQISRKFEECIESGDILARTGGDEFLIFRNFIDTPEEAISTVEKLIEITKNPFNVKGERVLISVSIGVSYFPQNALSLTELIKTADIAMYNAKTSGKNNYRIFNSGMADEVSRKSEMIAVLQTAIANEEMYMVYQPQADVATGKIIGCKL